MSAWNYFTFVPLFLSSGNNTNPTGVFEMDYLGKWTNLALMWTQRSGLEFYMDGRLIAIDPTGYRKFRVKDDQTRLILGRRNDFLGNAANFSWEETAIKEEILEPFKLKESLSRIGMIWVKQLDFCKDLDFYNFLFFSFWPIVTVIVCFYKTLFSLWSMLRYFMSIVMGSKDALCIVIIVIVIVKLWVLLAIALEWKSYLFHYEILKLRTLLFSAWIQNVSYTLVTLHHNASWIILK